MSEQLHIACSADERYVAHCAAMLHSVCTHHPPGEITIHFLHDDRLNPATLERLGSFVDRLGACWAPVHVTEDLAQGFPDEPRYGRLAWYRVLLADLLPNLDRILYLDVDLIVAAPLVELWQLDMDGDTVAAVTNPLYPTMSATFLGDLGLPSIDSYFNSGVLLLDLGRWRDGACLQAIRQAIRLGSGLESWPDQNVLNAVLWKRRRRLPPRWNAMTTLFELKDEQLPFDGNDLRHARTHPAIVHFIGPYKPWHYRCQHPFKHLYFEHLEATPWPRRPVEGRTPLNVVYRLLPMRISGRLEALIQARQQRLRG